MKIIVTRHKATVEFIRRELPEFQEARVLIEATAEDVRDRTVAGNLPLHLAAIAKEVWAVEFTGTPPRGKELTLADMDAAGATMRSYVVLTGTESDKASCHLFGGHCQAPCDLVEIPCGSVGCAYNV